MKRAMFYVLIIFPVLILLSGCVKQDPIFPTVIQEVKDGLKEKYASDLGQVTNMTIFESTLKVYMVETYPPENLENFARETTKLFGNRMRANKKLSQMYYINFFQKKKYEEKMQLKQVAECYFENGPDKIRVKLLGLGSGKYDVK